MTSSGNPDSIEHIIIRHGSRRRLLSKPPTFELLIQRSCEIFDFATNKEVYAYFMYRNNLGNYVNMELDPSAYFFLKSGDELEWKSTDLSTWNSSWDENTHCPPRYLGGGYKPKSRSEPSVREVGSEQNDQDDGAPVSWAQEDEEDDTCAGGHVETPTPWLWGEDEGMESDRREDKRTSCGGMGFDWRDGTYIPHNGVRTPPPPPSSTTSRIIRELKKFKGQPSPATSVESGVFSPRPGQKAIDGNEWLHPMASEYSPTRAQGRWARDDGSPTKGPRYTTLESWSKF